MGAWAGFNLKFTSRGPAPPRPLSQPSCPRTALPSPLLTHCDRPRVTCRASPLPLLLSDSSSPDLPGLADRQQEGRGERTRGPHGKEEKGGNGARTAGATPSARAVTQDEGERGNRGAEGGRERRTRTRKRGENAERRERLTSPRPTPRPSTLAPLNSSSSTPLLPAPLQAPSLASHPPITAPTGSLWNSIRLVKILASPTTSCAI